MRRDEAIAILKSRHAESKQMGISALYLFGSVARDEAGPKSDVDVLVELDHGPTLFELARIKLALERWFNANVDLGLWDSVRPSFRDRIYSEAIRAA